ncbi:hypothetical protein Tco_1341054, partial [Tanacetum coccineum]
KSHNVLEIAPMAIIDNQLPFEYTIASRSTDVMVWNAVYDAHNEELKFMFDKQDGVEQFDLIQTFHACKQEEGKSVSSYVLKIKGYVEQLERLGYMLPQDLIMAIQGGRIQITNKKSLSAKGKGKGKGNGKDKSYIPKPKNPKPYAKEHPKKDDAATTAKRWGIGLKGERNLKLGALYLCVGNGLRAQVESIGSDDLVLPNGLVVCLDNCHYAPTITRGVVSVSRLVDNGFIQCFTDYEILVSKNYVLYFNVIPSDGIYEIDMLNLVPNVNSNYNDSYFITFTDDYSRYGYVYLLKHKHEVFETFKVFKNVVCFRSFDKAKEDAFFLASITLPVQRSSIHQQMFHNPLSVESKHNKYNDIAKRVARCLDLDDPATIRLTSHNCYSRQHKL